MASRILTGRRLIFLIIAVVLVVGISSMLQYRWYWTRATRLREVRRTVEILRPLLAADPRFQKVGVSVYTSPGVALTGSVESVKDWHALREVVEQARLPRWPLFGVGISTNSPNKSDGANRRQPLGLRSSWGESGVLAFTAAVAHPFRYA